MDKSKITKQNGNIAFEEDAHIYYDITNPDLKFTSVTTMCSLMKDYISMQQKMGARVEKYPKKLQF